MLVYYPQVLDIRTRECKEPLIDVRHKKFQLIKYDPYINSRDDIKDSTHIRLGVYKRLVKAQNALQKKYGYSLRLICGYRSKKIQETLFSQFWQKNKTEFPNASDYEVYQKTIKLISPLKTWEGKINIPPHSTGGAIDVELIDAKGKVVDMGMDPKNCKSVPPEMCHPQSSLISQEAQHNRNILSKAMKDAGFVDHPTEFWHFSYGDRLWALHNKKPYAIYDSIELN